MKRYAVVNSAGELANLAGKDGKPGPAAVRKQFENWSLRSWRDKGEAGS